MKNKEPKRFMPELAKKEMDELRNTVKTASQRIMVEIRILRSIGSFDDDRLEDVLSC